jgi:uncharacterized protein (TIGR02594 family)
MRIKYLLVPLLLLALYTKSIMAETEITPEQSQAKIMVAEQYLDFSARSHRQELKEFTGVDPVRVAWCSAFVNAVLHNLGLPGSESVSDSPLLARSFLQWGKRVKEPQVGDIVIMPRGRQPWQGHVGFYYGTIYEKGKKYYQILGGNQSKRVTIKLIPVRSVIEIRRHSID